MYMYYVVDYIPSFDTKFWLQYIHVAVFTIHLALQVFYYLTFSLLMSLTCLCRYVYNNCKKRNVEYGSVDDKSIKMNYLRVYPWIQFA